MAKGSGGGGRFSIGRGRGDSATSFTVSGRNGVSANVFNVSGDKWVGSLNMGKKQSQASSAYGSKENAIAWSKNAIKSRGG